jgi:hypothetical protein
MVFHLLVPYFDDAKVPQTVECRTGKYLMNWKGGRAIAQAVSRCLLTAAARVQARV